MKLSNIHRLASVGKFQAFDARLKYALDLAPELIFLDLEYRKIS